MRKVRTLIFASMLLSSAPVFAADEHVNSSKQSSVQFVTLGTGGGPVLRRERSQPANAVIVDDAVYIFDAGDGVERQMLGAGLSLRQVKAVFLSHHHIDHTGGLASLLVNRWVLGGFDRLPVIGPPETAALTTAIGAGYRGTEIATASVGETRPTIASAIDGRDLPKDLGQPALIYEDDRIRVFAVTNDHYHFAADSPSAQRARSYSFRIEAGGRSFVFTGDTGVSPALERLAKDADLLVSEVMDVAAMRRSLEKMPGLSPQARSLMAANMGEDHLSPGQVGDLARSAGVKAVILTHLVPGRDGESDLGGYVDGVTRRFSGPVRIARDLDRF